jgi:hypothetical protein
MNTQRITSDMAGTWLDGSQGELGLTQAYEYLITWESAPFRLDLFDTQDARDGKSRLAYVFSHDGRTVFADSDFHASPMHAIDAPETVVALLGFLSLRAGDTDADYFDAYTVEQLAWRDEHAEYLSMWAQDDDESLAHLHPDLRHDEHEPAYTPLRAELRYSDDLGTIWVCLCCLFAREGDGCAGQHEHTDEPWALIDSDPSVRVTAGMSWEEHAGDCANRRATHSRIDDCDCERDSFSASSCDGCGSALAGERHAYTLWKQRRHSTSA